MNATEQPRPKWGNNTTPPVKLSIHLAGFSTLAEVESRPTEWLWKDRIPLGEITSIEGDPGSSKSSLTLDLAARVTTAASMPDGSEGVDGNVLLILGEDSLAKTVRKRLEVAGADLKRITTPNNQLTLGKDLAKIEEVICRTSCRLVVIDPLMAFLGVDSGSDQKVRTVMTPLQAIADKTNCAVVLVRHLTKKGGGPVMYRAGGSIGIAAAIRSGFLVARHPQNSALRVLAHYKSNLSALATSLMFEPVDVSGAPVLEWRGECELTAAELAATPSQQTPRLSEAMSFLVEQLSDGAVEQNKLKQKAVLAGIAVRTMEKAKELLQLVSTRKGFGPGSVCYWALPDKDSERS